MIYDRSNDERGEGRYRPGQIDSRAAVIDGMRASGEVRLDTIIVHRSTTRCTSLQCDIRLLSPGPSLHLPLVDLCHGAVRR